MLLFLKELRKEHKETNIIRIMNEWKWHNIAYNFGIKPDQTGSVDAYLNAPDKKWWFVFDFFWLW